MVGQINKKFEGGLPGSKPIYGRYQSMDIPVWGIKFFIDALLIDLGVNANEINS